MSKKNPKHPNLLPAAQRPMDLIGKEEVARIFSQDDISRIKIEILTSADPLKKIEALRKIALSSVPENEKAALFLRALADTSVDVRSEAVECLKQLGLNADVADTIRDLFQGSEAIRIHAAERLGVLVGEISDAEKSVVLLVLMDSLMDEVVPLVESLQTFRGLVDILAEHPEQTAKFTRFLVARLSTDPEQIEAHFLDLCRRIGERQRDVMWLPVYDELGKTRNPTVRGILLRVLWAIGPAPGEKSDLIDRTLEETANMDESTPRMWDIAGCLVRGGDESAVKIVEKLDGADEDRKIILSVLLDSVCAARGISGKTKRLAARALLATLKVAGKHLRNKIMECRIARDDELAKNTRREFVQEFVRGLEGVSERLRDSLTASVITIGETAIRPLVEMSRSARTAGERRRALELLGKVIAVTDAPSARREVDSAVAMCIRFLDSNFPDKGTAAAALGNMCTSPLVEEKLLTDAVTALTSRLGTTSFPYQILEGLGHICASPGLSLPLAVEVTELLLRYFDEELPEMTTTVTQDDERDNVYQFGIEISAYTVMIPLIITALQKLCLNTLTTVSLREQILESLLNKWQKVSSWKEIWGPGNTTDLARSLERIGCSDMVAEGSKLDILDALRPGIELPSVFQAVARICGSIPESTEADRIAEEVTDELFRAHPGFEDISPDTLIVLLPALGILGGRPRMSASADKDRRLRQTVVEILFDGIKNDVPGVGESLAKIAQMDKLPRALRTEITDRLRSKGIDCESAA